MLCNIMLQSIALLFLYACALNFIIWKPAVVLLLSIVVSLTCTVVILLGCKEIRCKTLTSDL